MCPLGKRLFNGEGGFLEPGELVCHVLLVELSDGLALVDTGFGTGDSLRPARAARPFNALVRPRLDLAETALSQGRELGFDPADVRHILLTHLDIDHGGGLPDFPDAHVHVYARELDAMRRPPLRERPRYLTAASHWAHGPKWVSHETAGDQWFGFESVRAIPGGDDEILLIPLPGHTLGHAGIAVRQSDGWLLHCGDAYFYRDEVSSPPSCPPGLRAFQNLVQANGAVRRQNQERLRELARQHRGEVELICSHDPVLLARAQAAG